MTSKARWILLIALCVGLAPWLSQARTLAHDPITQSLQWHEDCPMAGDSATHEGHQDKALLMHDCCIAWVGIWVDPGVVSALRHAGELIPFDPPFALSARHEGLFRPPRSFS